MYFQLMLSLVLLLVVVPVTAAQAQGFKAGKWSMTMTTTIGGDSEEAAEAAKAMKEMEDLPPEARAMMEKMQGSMGMKMGMGPGGGLTTTVTQCITEQDPVPDTKSGKNYQQTHEMKGNTVTCHVVCKDRGVETDTTGKMTYTGNSVKGETRSVQKERGRSTEAVVTIDGKYLGPCE